MGKDKDPAGFSGTGVKSSRLSLKGLGRKRKEDKFLSTTESLTQSETGDEEDVATPAAEAMHGWRSGAHVIVTEHGCESWF